MQGDASELASSEMNPSLSSLESPSSTMNLELGWHIKCVRGSSYVILGGRSSASFFVAPGLLLRALVGKVLVEAPWSASSAFSCSFSVRIGFVSALTHDLLINSHAESDSNDVPLGIFMPALI